MTDMEVQYPDAPEWAHALSRKIDDISNRLDRYQAMAEVGHQIAKDAKELAKENRDHLSELEERILILENQLQHQEDYSRRLNLKIDGIPETQEETPAQLLDKLNGFFQNDLQIMTNMHFERFHRLGKKSNSRVNKRTVIVRFRWYEDRDLVWSQRSKLRGKKIFIQEDYTLKRRSAHNQQQAIQR